MKKIFGMRKHRDRDRELDKRYRDELEEYEDDYYEDDYEDDDYSDEDYAEDDDYSDEDYIRDDENYSDEDYVGNDDFVDLDEEDIEDEDEFYAEDEYPEEVDDGTDADSEDRAEDAGFETVEIDRDLVVAEMVAGRKAVALEDEADYVENDDRDYAEDDDCDYEEDDRDYEEDDRDYAEDEENYESDEYERDDRDYAEDDDDREEDDRDYADDDYDREEDDRDYADDDRDDVENDRYYEDEEDYREDDRDYADDDYDREYEDDRDYYEDDDDYGDDDYEDDYRDSRRGRRNDRRDRDYDEDDYRDNRRGGRGKDRYDRGRDEDRYDRGRSRRDRDDDEESVGAKIIGFLAKTTAVERIAAVFALLILAGGIATAAFYATAMNGNKQLESFGEIGTGLADVEMIGQSGLIAVADAEKARAMAAQFVAEDTEEEEEEIEVADDAENVTIKMTVTSIKSDIKVKFINSATGKLVANLPLEIEVVGPDGNTVTYNDHDQDGIIYKKDMTKGDYKVTPKPLGSGYENYKLETTSKTVTVKDTVEMKAVDVSNEVKKESQVNVAKEDTQVKAEVESALQDTVEWVESTKTALGEKGDGSVAFEEISKDRIPSPDSSSMLGNRKWMFLALTSGEGATNIEETETPGSAEPGEGKPDESGKESSKEEEKPKEEETPKEKDKIKISANSEMTEGDTQEVSISGTNESVTLESDDTGVVSVSGKTLKAEKAGTAKITASGNNCESAEITITVKAKEKAKEDFSVNGSTVSVKVGESKSIGASATSSISYESKDTSIATVDGSGNVTGVKEGSTTITLKADGYNDGTVNVSVAKADAKDMKAEPEKGTIKVGETTQIKVTGPESGKTKFESSDKAIATVGETDGKVTGVKEGTVTITVKADGYKDATVSITVSKADLKAMTVDPASVTVKVSEEKQITVKGLEAGKVKFESADKNIATVGDTDGKVKGVSVGKTTIKITSDGYSDLSVNVEVVAKDATVPMKITKLTLVEEKSVKISSSDSKLAIRLESADPSIAAISDNTTITGKAAGETTVKVKADNYSDATITVKVVSKNTVLKDKDGNEIWVLKSDGDYYKATYEDYYTRDKFFIKTAAKSYKYTGWQTIDGKTYFFDKNGNYVTGEQVIQGAKYSFGADGVLAKAPGAMGIDVSKWNGNIDWNAVKNSGVQFVIIRCGYRGSSEGALIEDAKFKSNIKGAQAAGLKVGVYFFTQAVNEVEAVEEASMVINLIKGYTLSFPVYLDVEGSKGRGDTISASQRTANIKAFCGTIQNAGYKAGVYANKTWFTSMINTSQITNYKIWLAQYASAVTYTGSRYDMWQYTSKGKVTGISGNVDMNICY